MAKTTPRKRPGAPLKIEVLYAYLSVDEAGDEGLCGYVPKGGGPWTPMIGADWKRVQSLKGIARELARESGRAIRLAIFGTREDLEVIQP